MARIFARSMGKGLSYEKVDVIAFLMLTRHTLPNMRKYLIRKWPALVVAGGGIILLVAGIAWQQRTRTIEGTWIDLFEGSSFFEGKDLEWACSPNFDTGGWLSFYPGAGSPHALLLESGRFGNVADVEQSDGRAGIFASEYGSWPVAAYKVRFVGRQRVLGLGFGHLGGSPSEFKVDRMLAIEPLEVELCDVRRRTN